jgi:hypothetical protein
MVQRDEYDAMQRAAFPAHEMAKEIAARLAEETAIVDRIWDIYGRPSYESLQGRSLYDLINADRARLAEAEMLLRQCSAVWHDKGPLPAIIAGFLATADSADVGCKCGAVHGIHRFDCTAVTVTGGQ